MPHVNGYVRMVQNFAKHKCLIIWFHFPCRCEQTYNKVFLLAFKLPSTEGYNLQIRHLYSDIRLNKSSILEDTTNVVYILFLWIFSIKTILNFAFWDFT